MTELPNKALLRVDEVAEYFRVCRQTIYNWIDSGSLIAEKMRGKGAYRIPRESVKTFLENSRHDPDCKYGV